MPFPADGFDAAWTSTDGVHREDVALRWDNEAWTISGKVGEFDVEYVLRLSPLFEVRQFLLFRDLDEPDLWLGTDGSGRWGEVNGAHRPDLDGCFDIVLACTPFTHTIPIRRLPLDIGEAAELRSLRVDVETLGVVPIEIVFERSGDHHWRVIADGEITEFDVDDHGLPMDVPGRFLRAG